MTRLARVCLVGAAAVVAYDVVMSVASRTLGFDYATALPGSFLLYLATGFFGARAAGRLRAGALAGGAAGFADATVGWLLSVAIGADGAVEPATPLTIALVVVVVTLMAASVGLFGAVVERLTGRIPRRGPQVGNGDDRGR